MTINLADWVTLVNAINQRTIAASGDSATLLTVPVSQPTGTQIAAYQTAIEAVVTVYANTSANPDSFDGLAAVPVYTVSTWRAAAGINASGFTRIVSATGVNAHGHWTSGDMIGGWLLTELFSGITALVKTALSIATFDGDFGWGGNIGHETWTGVASATAIAEASWPGTEAQAFPYGAIYEGDASIIQGPAPAPPVPNYVVKIGRSRAKLNLPSSLAMTVGRSGIEWYVKITAAGTLDWNGDSSDIPADGVIHNWASGGDSGGTDPVTGYWAAMAASVMPHRCDEPPLPSYPDTNKSYRGYNFYVDKAAIVWNFDLTHQSGAAVFGPSGPYGPAANEGPRCGFNYAAPPPAGVQPSGSHGGHTADAYIESNQVLDHDQAEITSLWGYAHRGFVGLTQAQADARIDEVQFWLLEDTDADGTSNEAATTPWRKVASYAPSSGAGHVKGWMGGVIFQALDGSGTAWEGQDVLQGAINGLQPGRCYFLLIRAVSGSLTSTMPQDALGNVTGPDEFTPAATNITKTGNGGAIKAWHVAWFRVNQTPERVQP